MKTKDQYVYLLRKRIIDKNGLLEEYERRLKGVKGEYTYNAFIEEIEKLKRGIFELNFCLKLYKEVKGGLKK